jgi:ribosomal protein L16 Arg81 hydroxylase
MLATESPTTPPALRPRATARDQSSIERLLSPMGWDTFLGEVWERRPHHFAGRSPDHYADILTAADLDAIVLVSASSKLEQFVNLVRFGDTGQIIEPIPRTAEGMADLRHAYRAYDAGYSVKVDGLQTRWRPVARACGELQQALHHPVGAYLFATPAGAQAFAAHFDPYDTFLLQIDGVKHWRVYDPITPLPLPNMVRPVDPAELGRPMMEVALRAGDLLYIPRGYVHQGLTSGVSSLHLTLAVRAIRWSQVFEQALALAAARDVRLRTALPAGFLDRDEALAEMAGRFRELIGRAFDGVAFDDVLTSLRQTFADHQQVPLGGQFTSLDRVRDIRADTVVERRSGMACFVTRTDRHARIWFAGSPIETPRAIEPALRFVAERQRFAPRDLPDCLTENGKLVLVRRLVREGLLAVEGAAPSDAGGGSPT